MKYIENISRLMAEKGLSRPKLADAIGVTPRVVNYWLSGTRVPNPKAKKALADLFNQPVAQLFCEDGHPMDDLWHNREPWVVQDPEHKREWLIEQPLRYYVHQSPEGSWLIVDRWEDSAISSGHKTREAAIRAFYHMIGRKVPTGRELPRCSDVKYSGKTASESLPNFKIVRAKVGLRGKDKRTSTHHTHITSKP